MSAAAGPPQGQFNQYMQPQGSMGYQPQQQQQQTFMNPPAAMGTTQTPTPEPAVPPMAPQPKAPLPEEYVYLQTVFNELRQQCSNAAANPVREDCLVQLNGLLMTLIFLQKQMKRKLEDVAKRLESLYDLLRDNRVSTGQILVIV